MIHLQLGILGGVAAAGASAIQNGNSPPFIAVLAGKNQ
jgi:hypothetical protein